MHGSSFVVEADATARDCRFVAAQAFCKFNLGRPMDCRKRVKRLEEEAGIVTGHVAVLAAERMGLSSTAYLNEHLEKHAERHKRNPIDLFRAAVQTWPAAVECAALTGVQDCKTSFVLGRVQNTSSLPV